MVCLPVLARPLHLSEAILCLDLRRALEELNTETGSHVEGDVAVHQPRSGIIGLEGENKVASGGEVGCVTANGVVGLEAGDVAIPDCVLLLIQNVEVVAVEMDRMRQWWRSVVGGVLLDDPVLPLQSSLVATTARQARRLTLCFSSTSNTCRLLPYVTLPSRTCCRVGRSRSIAIGLPLTSHCTSPWFCVTSLV